MAIDFTGAAGADVDLGNPTSLQITGAFTVMCWVCLDASPQNVEIVTKQTAGDRGFSLQTDDDPPNDTWGIFVIAKTSSTTMSSGWTAFKLSPGVWYHIAGQFVPSTAVQIWLDGVLSNEKTTGVPATMYNSGNNVTIAGRPPPDSNSNVDGKIEDVRFYKDHVFSAAEMSTIHAGRGHDKMIDGMVSRLMLNEGAPGASVTGASSVKDLGVNGNHGSPSGSNLYAESVLEVRG